MSLLRALLDLGRSLLDLALALIGVAATATAAVVAFRGDPAHIWFAYFAGGFACSELAIRSKKSAA